MVTSKKHGCSCEKCAECCRREPGWFLPDEIAVAANFLNLTEEEFIRKFSVEHIEDGVLAISPATKPGSGECVFLNKQGLCEIHPVKPYECRKVYGCGPENRHRRVRERIKERWK